GVLFEGVDWLLVSLLIRFWRRLDRDAACAMGFSPSIRGRDPSATCGRLRMTCNSNTRRTHPRLPFRLSVVGCGSEKSGRGFLHGDYTTRKIGVGCQDASTGGQAPPLQIHSRAMGISAKWRGGALAMANLHHSWLRAKLNLNPHPFKPKRVR